MHATHAWVRGRFVAKLGEERDNHEKVLRKVQLYATFLYSYCHCDNTSNHRHTDVYYVFREKHKMPGRKPALITQNKDAWAQAEKIRRCLGNTVAATASLLLTTAAIYCDRETWINEKTKSIKALTIKGSTPTVFHTLSTTSHDTATDVATTTTMAITNNVSRLSRPRTGA